jgi:hypothetical protein
MPRPRLNTRVRDLPDIALLATTGPIDGKLLRQAIDRTFEFRSTHVVPAMVPTPPDFWEAPYAAMAATDELPWTTLRQVTEAVSSFLDPVLRSVNTLSWEPAEWSWR